MALTGAAIAVAFLLFAAGNFDHLIQGTTAEGVSENGHIAYGTIEGLIGLCFAYGAAVAGTYAIYNRSSWVPNNVPTDLWH